MTTTLPAVTHGRHWQTVDGAICLVSRTGRRLGYLSEYDNGWGANIVSTSRGHSWRGSDGQRYRSIPGAFASEELAAAALLRAV